MAGQPFTNLVRFQNDQGKILWGDASPDWLDSLVGSTATVLEGHPFDGGLTRTSKTDTIKKVNCASWRHTGETADNTNGSY